MLQSAPSYSISRHAELGDAGGLVQVKLGHVTHCCSVRRAFLQTDQSRPERDGALMLSVVLQSPVRGFATVPAARVKHCGGIDGACSCQLLTRTRAEPFPRVALPRGETAEPGAASNTAPKSHA